MFKVISHTCLLTPLSYFDILKFVNYDRRENSENTLFSSVMTRIKAGGHLLFLLRSYVESSLISMSSF